MYTQLIKAVAVPVIKETTKETLKHVGIIAAFFGGCTLISTANYAMINGVKMAMDEAHERRQERRRAAEAKMDSTQMY